MGDASQKKICLGVVIGAHGVRGLVKVKPFTDEPGAVAAYGPVETRDGARRFRIEAKGMVKDAVLCALEGVADRDAADALRGTELYVLRDRLPALSSVDGDADESWYQADLVGLKALGLDGAVLGEVLAVQNFGAGDLLELRLEGEKSSLLIPFTRECVPRVDVAGGFVTIDPPQMVGEGEEGQADG